MELQDDLDHANAALQQKNGEMKTKTKSLEEAEKCVELLTNSAAQKDDEINKLNEEVAQSMAQVKIVSMFI